MTSTLIAHSKKSQRILKYLAKDLGKIFNFNFEGIIPLKELKNNLKIFECENFIYLKSRGEKNFLIFNLCNKYFEYELINIQTMENTKLMGNAHIEGKYKIIFSENFSGDFQEELEKFSNSEYEKIIAFFLIDKIMHIRFYNSDFEELGTRISFIYK